MERDAGERRQRSGYALNATIVQGDAIRGAGGSVVSCGGVYGDLPLGDCTDGPVVLCADNDLPGPGSLSPGAATAHIQLSQYSAQVAEVVVPITLQ